MSSISWTCSLIFYAKICPKWIFNRTHLCKILIAQSYYVSFYISILLISIINVNIKKFKLKLNFCILQSFNSYEQFYNTKLFFFVDSSFENFIFLETRVFTCNKIWVATFGFIVYPKNVTFAVMIECHVARRHSLVG